MQNIFSFLKVNDSAFEKKVVFITGLYKSGTSWLSLILGKHPQAMALTEFDVIRAFALTGQSNLEGKEIYDRLKYVFGAASYGGLPLEIIQQSADVEREKLFDFFESNAPNQIILDKSFIDYGIDRNAGSKICGHGIDLGSYLNYWNLDQKSANKVFVGSLLESDPKKAIRNFCKVHQEFAGGFLVLKSADQINHLKHLQRVMPQSPKILIIRDGRDMAISATKFEQHYIKQQTHFADIWKMVETDFWNRLQQWRTIARTVDSYRQKGELYVLRYEDLINNFDFTVTSLLDHLGLHSGIETVKHMRAETTFEKMSGGRSRGEEDLASNIRSGLVGEWQHVLDDSEKQNAWDSAGAELSLFGYHK